MLAGDWLQGGREPGSHGRGLHTTALLVALTCSHFHGWGRKQEDSGSGCRPHLQAGGHTGTGCHSRSVSSAVNLLPAPVTGQKLAAVWPAAITRFLKCTMFTSFLFGLSDQRESSSCPWPRALEGQRELPVGLAPGLQGGSPWCHFSRVRSRERFPSTSALSPLSLFPVIYMLQAR